ncbi:MAG TPA: DsbA family protein [Candidatus Doudnabacteria bacterium]|nr:DsbA family protein [Candidatus Doudnabacteria bacterium]
MIDNPENFQQKQKNLAPWIITILIAAWLIGLSILGAGWLIAQEIAKQGTGLAGGSLEQQGINYPIDIQIPENVPQQGSDDAKVTIIEFADFQCSFCNQWHQEIYPKLKSEYIDTGKVKFAFWDFAFLGEESFKAAEASMCSKDQDKFWEYHDALFNVPESITETNPLNDTALKQIASDIGLNTAEFNQCFDARIHKPIVEDLTNQGVNFGVNSTPTIFINGLKFEGVLPWETYKQIIETELAK